MSWLSHRIYKLKHWLQKPEVKRVLEQVQAAMGNKYLMALVDLALKDAHVEITDAERHVADDIVDELVALSKGADLGIDAANIIIAKLSDPSLRLDMIAKAIADGVDETTATAMVDETIAELIALLRLIK